MGIHHQQVKGQSNGCRYVARKEETRLSSMTGEEEWMEKHRDMEGVGERRGTPTREVAQDPWASPNYLGSHLVGKRGELDTNGPGPKNVQYNCIKHSLYSISLNTVPPFPLIGSRTASLTSLFPFLRTTTWYSVLFMCLPSKRKFQFASFSKSP